MEASFSFSKAMQSHQKSFTHVATIGIDIGKMTFHLIGQDGRGVIVMRAKVSRSQLFQRLANIPSCVIWADIS